MIHRDSLTVLAIVCASAMLIACSPSARVDASASPAPYASPSGDAVDKARSEASEAGDKIKDGAQKTGEVIKEAAQDVKENAKPVAKDVSQKVKEGAHETGEFVDATKQHLDVKAALLADKSVDASHIDIDVNKDTKTLYLRGTVPTAAQKARAEKIAKDKADGFVVRNELTVMAKP
jgi:hyperosmotically inducible periplasmic protein